MLGFLSNTIFLIVGILGVFFSYSISGFSFDPIGPSLIPKLVSVFLVLFSVLSFVHTYENRKESYDLKQIVIPLLCFLYVVLFIFIVFLVGVPFSISVSVMFFLISSAISENNKSVNSLKSAFIGFLIGVFSEIIFTRFFFVDLPTIW